MGEHSKFSPSSAARIIACPGSYYLNRDAPHTTNAAAEEGTLAHAYCEAILTNKEPPIVSEEMKDNCSLYIDYVNRLRDRGYTVLIEARVSFDDMLGITGGFGTADCIAIKDNRMEVIDLKYGQVKVSAENNPQLQLYALGAWELIRDFIGHNVINDVALSIIQPKHDIIDTWKVPSLGELMVFAMYTGGTFKHAESLQEDTYKRNLRVSESACKYCPSYYKCEAFEKIPEKIKDETMTLEEKLDMIPLLEKWAMRVREDATSHLMFGGEIEGWELGMGRRGNAEWKDEKAAMDYLLSFDIDKDNITEIVSPTKVFKFLKKDADILVNLEQDHIVRKEPKKDVLKRKTT